ncbi:MAG: YtxH domain-containing protein [Saprospirales bacterium]|nr:MAG: YtxH domain-containing protein [Saprospirales bacterium]
MNTVKVILGTMTGLVLGVAVGILFAPKKGSATRKEIMDKGEDYVDELKLKLNEFSDSISEKIEATQNNDKVIAKKTK